jgi:hypothetical protein
LNVWRRWLREPQTLLLRRALFQVHLWTGVAVGLYVAMISLTGSILVYRNELYRAFSPEPRLVQDPGVALPLDDLEQAVKRTFPDARVVVVEPGPTPNHAVDVTLERDGGRTRRLVHPATGADLGPTLPLCGEHLMLDLVTCSTTAAAASTVSGDCAADAVHQQPDHLCGATVAACDRHGLSWKRLNWSLHSVLGFWFSVHPDVEPDRRLPRVAGPGLGLLDYIEPLDQGISQRVVDRIRCCSYCTSAAWVAAALGRPRLCDSITKATWAPWASCRC